MYSDRLLLGMGGVVLVTLLLLTANLWPVQAAPPFI
jgi:hypothetical protein